MADKEILRRNVFVHDDRVSDQNGDVLFEKSPQTTADVASLIRWLGKNRGISSPTLWLLGAELAERFGWLDVDASDEQLADATGDFIKAEIKKAFEAQTQGKSVVVQRAAYRFTVYPHWNQRGGAPVAEIVVARLAGELADGHRGVLDDLRTDDPEAEIVSRIRFVAEHLKINAAGPGALLASRLADRVWSPPPPQGVWPLDDLAPTMFEPVQSATAPEPKLGEKLVVVDQRKAVLAAMGTVRFGMGDPREMPGSKVDWHSSEAPCTAVDVMLPALDSLGIPHVLAVHPLQRPDRTVQARVSTITVKQMLLPTADGGLGMDLDDVEFGDALVWPETSTKLATWTKHMREFFVVAGEDASLLIMLKEMYARYYKYFESQYSKGPHSQPVFSGLIRADMRCRSLRYARLIEADERCRGLLPIAAQTDAWFYVVPDDFDTSVFNAYDTLVNGKHLNGKYRVKDEKLGTEPPKTPPATVTTAAGPATSAAAESAEERGGRGILTKLFGRDRR
ncbi:hypothetical protein [Mycobacteroides abscessus]|uniref:hypothetical protein n=1 Tax=Mycobacteroides abscessus TaxID=36809 RepID=UPI002105938F|nr:hypothetical protein [Mycobacteroides abscessus]